MNKETSSQKAGKTKDTAFKGAHPHISYEKAMEFARQNELANSWRTSNNSCKVSFIDHLHEMNKVIESEAMQRIKESKNGKTPKNILNGENIEEFALLAEHEMEDLEN